MERSRTSSKWKLAWLCFAGFMASTAIAKASAEDNSLANGVEAHQSPRAPIEERMKLEPILIALVQGHIAKEERLPGQQAIVVAKVWYSEEGDTINVDLGREYLPTHYTMTFEERVNDIAALLYEAEKPTPIYKVDVWFDGKDIFDYFPEERGPADRSIPKADVKPSLRSKRSVASGKVLISAGHGVYYNSKYKDWRAQRESVNSVVEDFSTPLFARYLSRYLIERSDVEAFLARPQELSRHPESGRPWSSIAARYHVKSAFPEMESLWNSLGEHASEPGLEERDQDIRSRPLYANHLAADAVIHLHTNAHANPSVRGIRVFHHPRSPESKRFGDLALCYMQESLSSNEFYASFPMTKESTRFNHGENRLANMPSIIAELGFHTNEDDANAIRSYVFQDLTSRGLEKAYRMFKEGNGCQHFTATYPEVVVVSDSTGKAEIVFAGFPRFPVRYESTVAECPSGIMCRPFSGRFKDANAPRSITHSCYSQKQMTIKWNVTFIDADGVKAKTVAALHCQPKA